MAALGGAFHHAAQLRLKAGSPTVDAVASGATAHATAGLSRADTVLLQDAAHAALTHGLDVVALTGAAIIVAGTATSLLLARGLRLRSTAVPAPVPAS